MQPGNQRSAIWSDQPLNHDTWIADVDFRASGPERGGGNLNIWLTGSDVGTSSMYTVGRFEGLGIVVDTYGGTGGMVRGFLNDGSVDFASKPSLDGLVFGQCQYSYRNLGRPSQIKLRQESDNFRVEVDGRLCFESKQVQLPQGYKFGLTAATPDNPDSFEVFKLVVMGHKSGNNNNNNNNQQQQQQQQKAKPKQQQQQKKKDDKPKNQFFQRDEPAADDPIEDIPDQDADTITSSAQQFADLHDRLQVLNHHVSAFQKSLGKATRTADTRHGELKKLLSGLSSDLSALSQLEGLTKKIEGLEKEVKGLRNEVSNKMRASEKNLKTVLTDHHASIADNIPSHSKLVAVVVGCQVVLVGLYVLYKRRQNNMPKKYV